MYSNNTLASKTLFVYDGFKCVEELDAFNGNIIIMRHSWQPFDIGMDTLLVTTDVIGALFFLHDANKNIMQKTDANNAIHENYVYAPFGYVIGTNKPHIGFSSEVNNETIGTIYYNFRYLTPKHGRWINYEPNPNIQIMNIVSFVNNNPIYSFDYLGNQSFSVQIGIWHGIDIRIGLPNNDYEEARWRREQEDRKRAEEKAHQKCCNGQKYDDRTSCCENNTVVSKVPIWVCLRSLDVDFFRYFIIGPISHTFISCEDPNINPNSRERYGKQPRKKGLPQPPCGAFYGPGYVCREDSKFTTNPSYCVKKMVCPSEYARMCKEGTTESPYFLPSPFHNCHAWGNCRSK